MPYAIPKKEGACGQYRRGTQHSDTDGCPPIPLPKPEPNLSLYDSCHFWAASSLLEPRVSVCEQDFVHWFFKRPPGFPVSLVSSCWMESLLIFTAKYYGASSSQHSCCRLGSLAWGWDLTFLKGYLCSWDIPFGFSASACLCSSLSFLPVSVWLL